MPASNPLTNFTFLQQCLQRNFTNNIPSIGIIMLQSRSGFEWTEGITLENRLKSVSTSNQGFEGFFHRKEKQTESFYDDEYY